MKKRLSIAVAVVLAVTVLGFSVMQRPRRPRPEGYDSLWAALPVSDESNWAPDAQRREVVMAIFLEARESLQHCNEELYRAPTSGAVTIELLLQRQPEGMQLVYARAEDLPRFPRLGRCLEQALEATQPASAPGIPAGTRWRLSAKIFLHPEDELPPIPWWHRFVPPSWRSGGDSAIHIG